MSFKNWSVKKALPYIMIVAGIIGYAAASIILYDKFKIANDPNFKPACDINPVISCGSIMNSDQSHAFGFPNPFIGMAGFPMLAVIGAAILAGGTFKRWFWVCINVGMLFALGFVHWLFFESVYRINALCPYCMAVWVVSITSFWYITLYNIDQGNIRLPKGRVTVAYAWIRRHHLDILIFWLLVLLGLILKHFWYYYGRNF